MSISNTGTRVSSEGVACVCTHFHLNDCHCGCTTYQPDDDSDSCGCYICRHVTAPKRS